MQIIASQFLVDAVRMMTVLALLQVKHAPLHPPLSLYAVAEIGHVAESKSNESRHNAGPSSPDSKHFDARAAFATSLRICEI